MIRIMETIEGMSRMMIEECLVEMDNLKNEMESRK